MFTRSTLVLVIAAGLLSPGASAPSDTAGAPSFVPVLVGLVGSPQRVETGDLDGDGDPDLIVLASSAIEASLVALRNDDGTLVPAWTTALTPSALPASADLEVGDLDGDGDLDLLVSLPGAGTSTRLNAGDGTFDAIVAHATDGLRIENELADLDGDGALDLALHELSLIGYVGTRAGQGDGSFAAFGPEIPGGGTDPALRAALADATGDGTADLVLASADGLQLAVGAAGPGFPGWSFPVVGLAAGTYTDVAAADLDGDQRTDVVAASADQDGVAMLLGGPGGVGAPTLFATGPKPNALAIADFDGDLLLDVAVTDARRGVLSLLPGDGSGGLGAPTEVFVGRSPTDVTALDLEGDGDTDLAVASGAGRVVLLVNQTVP